MNAGIIAMRYARALLEYTERAEVSEQVYKEMTVLAHNFAKEPRLRRVLANPILGQPDKIALLKSALGGEQATPQALNFITLVVRKHREHLLQEMALSYRELYHKARNISLAYLETAAPIPEKTLERIRQLIEARTKGEVDLKTSVDPELIGGFVFQMDFRRIDTSVRTQLAEIKRHFVEENRRTI